MSLIYSAHKIGNGITPFVILLYLVKTLVDGVQKQIEVVIVFVFFGQKVNHKLDV